VVTTDNDKLVGKVGTVQINNPNIFHISAWKEVAQKITLILQLYKNCPE
jgi:hypothetical protein